MLILFNKVGSFKALEAATSAAKGEVCPWVMRNGSFSWCKSPARRSSLARGTRGGQNTEGVSMAHGKRVVPCTNKHRDLSVS